MQKLQASPLNCPGLAWISQGRALICVIAVLAMLLSAFWVNSRAAGSNGGLQSSHHLLVDSRLLPAQAILERTQVSSGDRKLLPVAIAFSKSAIPAINFIVRTISSAANLNGHRPRPHYSSSHPRAPPLILAGIQSEKVAL